MEMPKLLVKTNKRYSQTYIERYKSFVRIHKKCARKSNRYGFSVYYQCDIGWPR